MTLSNTKISYNYTGDLKRFSYLLQSHGHAALKPGQLGQIVAGINDVEEVLKFLTEQGCKNVVIHPADESRLIALSHDPKIMGYVINKGVEIEYENK